MKAKNLILITSAIILIMVIASVGKYAKDLYKSSIGNNTGYGAPTKIIVDNATVKSSDHAILLSGMIENKTLSVTLNDHNLKLPVIIKKTSEATVYRYKTHQKNKYLYYADSQGTLKNY